MKQTPIHQLSALTLAYIGDAVYDAFVRTELIAAMPDEPVHVLHMRATRIVRASAQAHTLMAIFEDLTEPERAVYKRGRNAHSATVPKNASVTDYRMATGFEALLGWLYLSGEQARLEEILHLARHKGWKELDSWQGQA